MNVGALVTNVGFKIDKQSVQRVTSQTQHIGRQIGYLIGAATAVEGIKNLFQYTAQMEMLSVQFGVLVSNMQEGRKIMGEIREMAAITPFETKELAGAVRLMMTFGAETEKVLGYTSMLGDITMGDKVRFGQMSLAFSQMLAANKLMGQDLLQMVQGGYNPLKTIAEMREISYDEALKMMAKDQIKPEMVIAAMQRDTQVGGKFYRGMLEGAKTMSGLWSTVSDTTKSVALLIGNMFSSGIKENMAGFINMINNGMPMIKTFMSYLNVSFDRIGGALKELGRVWLLITANLAPVFLGMVHVFSIAFEGIKTTIIGVLWAIAPIVDTFLKTIVEIFAVFDASTSDSSSLLLVFGGVMDGVRNIAVSLAIALKTVTPIIIALTSMISVLMDVLGWLQDKIELLSYVITSVLVLGALGLLKTAIATQIIPALISTGVFSATASAGMLSFAASMYVAVLPILAVVAALMSTYYAYKKIKEAMIMSGDIGTDEDRDRIQAQRLLNSLKEQGKALDKEIAKETDPNKLKQLKQSRISIDKSSRAYQEMSLENESSPMGIMSSFTDALSQFKGTGESELSKMISGMERAMAKFNLKQTNNINVNTTVDDKGKTQLSPEALQHSLDKAARSMFSIQLLGVRQVSV